MTINSSAESEAEEDDGRFEFLLQASQKFCEAVGLHKDLILQIAKTDTDWGFILKIDALLETAAKEILTHSLKLDIFGKASSNDDLKEFVNLLPMNGRTSLLALLRAAGCPPEEHGFIESVRRVRNAYAHDIKYIDVSLIELIKRRGDKAQLIKNLSAIEKYNEAALIHSYEKDGGMMRFGILDSAMRFLFYAYHIAVK
jgi:hypothetical protein